MATRRLEMRAPSSPMHSSTPWQPKKYSTPMFLAIVRHSPNTRVPSARPRHVWTRSFRAAHTLPFAMPHQIIPWVMGGANTFASKIGTNPIRARGVQFGQHACLWSTLTAVAISMHVLVRAAITVLQKLSLHRLRSTFADLKTRRTYFAHKISSATAHSVEFAGWHILMANGESLQ